MTISTEVHPHGAVLKITNASLLTSSHIYHCASHPHQPSTLLITTHFFFTLLYFFLLLDSSFYTTMADQQPKTLLDTYRPALAEFFAMTLFVWCGCGTAVSVQAMPLFNSARPADTSLLASISMAFGLAIAVLVYTIAPISGGHINPAVTFAFVVSGKMPILDGLRYVVAQCLGAFLGASIVWGTTASDLLTMSMS